MEDFSRDRGRRTVVKEQKSSWEVAVKEVPNHTHRAGKKLWALEALYNSDLDILRGTT